MITNAILIAMVATSVLAMAGENGIRLLSFHPYVIKRRQEHWRWVTHAFVHAGFVHLAVNALVFSSFGPPVEGFFVQTSSPWWFLLFFLLAAVASSFRAYQKHRDNPHYRAVGASGAVSAVLFCFVLLQPTASIYLLFIPVGIPAFIMGGLYLWYEYYMNKRATGHIAHDAHYFGALFGLVFTIVYKPSVLTHFVSEIFRFFGE